MEPIRCYCGFPISNIYEAFKLASKIYLEKANKTDIHINYNSLTPGDVDQSHIFKALGVENFKYCCKTRLVATAQFHEQEVQFI